MRRRKMLADSLQVPDFGMVGDVIGPTGELLASAEEMEITLDAAMVEDLYTFDTLPRPIRWALHEAVLVWRAEPFATFLAPHRADFLGMAQGIQHAMQAIATEQSREQHEFALHHRQRYGYPLPHMAARATNQRYGPRQ